MMLQTQGGLISLIWPPQRPPQAKVASPSEGHPKVLNMFMEICFSKTIKLEALSDEMMINPSARFCLSIGNTAQLNRKQSRPPPLLRKRYLDPLTRNDQPQGNDELPKSWFHDCQNVFLRKQPKYWRLHYLERERIQHESC